MRVRPSTLTPKMAMSTISGARIRRRIRKIVSEARLADAAAARSRARRARRSSSSRRRWRAQNVSSGLPTASSGSPAVEGHGLDHQQHDGDDVGHQRATGQRHDARRPPRGHARRRDVLGVAVDQRGPDQLEAGHEAGRQVDRADLGAVAELQHGRDQVDDDRGEQLEGVVQLGAINVADEEPEVQGGGEQDEEPEDDLLQVHPDSLRRRCGEEVSIPVPAPERYRRRSSGSTTRSTSSVTTAPSSARPVTSQRRASTAGPTSAATDSPAPAGPSPRPPARASTASQAASQLASGRRRQPSCSTGSSTTAPSRLRSARPVGPPNSSTTSVRRATRSPRRPPVSGTSSTGAPTTSITLSSSSALLDQRR